MTSNKGFYGCCLFLILHASVISAQSTFSAEYFHSLRFAHRGGYSEFWAENSIETIVHNIKNLGATAIEIDIEVTKDNQLVAFHDKELSRLLATNSKKTINEITLDELAKIPLRSDSLQYIPTLQEIIDTLIILSRDHRFVLELDFKPTSESAIIELMRIVIESEIKIGVNIYDYFFVSTFYPQTLKSIRKKSKHIKTALAVHSQPNEKKLAANLAIIFAPIFIRKYDSQIIEPNECLVTERFVKKWKKRGVLINTYTVNAQCEREFIESLEIAYTTNCIEGFCSKDFSGQLSKPSKWCKKCND